MRTPNFLLLCVALATATAATGCSKDTTGSTSDSGAGKDSGPSGDGGGDGDAGGHGDGDGDAGGGGDGDGDAGGGSKLDSGSDACVPLGCDEQGFECGQATDGCGGPLNCDPSDGSNPCTNAFDTCGGDPAKGANKCSCKATTCTELGAICGTVSDGCGGQLTCGTPCPDQNGGNDHYVCADDAKSCQCVADSVTVLCTNRECGAPADGCGGTVSCGTCSASKKCSETSSAATCVCDPSKAATACGSATCGTVTTADGCQYSCPAANPVACGSTCTSGGTCGGASSCECPGQESCISGHCCIKKTQDQACGTQDCGTASDGCGGTYQCGTHAGGCATGEACADPTYNLDSSVPVCINSDEAHLLGKYLVRIQSYRDSTATPTNRADALSLVTIQRTGGSLRLTDVGCAATSIDQNGGTKTLAPAYFSSPPAVVTLTVPHDGTWTRNWYSGNGQPAGFEPVQPSYCNNGTLTTPNAGTTGGDYDVTVGQFNDFINDPTPDTGPNKSWLGNKNCTCPTGNYTAFPTQNLGDPTKSTDCRINDLDDDGVPGVSILAQVAATLRVGAVTYANTEWIGTIAADGRHRGVGGQLATINRQYVSCTGVDGKTSLLCSFISSVSDSGCGQARNLIFFTPLIGADLKLTCLDFYDHAPPFTTVDDLNQDKVNGYFSGLSGTSCTTNTDCADAGTICNGGLCWPMTTPGACNGGTCRDGWTCGSSDKACWPATCP